MFEKSVKHRANDASNDGHRPPLPMIRAGTISIKFTFFFFESLPKLDGAPGRKWPHYRLFNQASEETHVSVEK